MPRRGRGATGSATPDAVLVPAVRRIVHLATMVAVRGRHFLRHRTRRQRDAASTCRASPAASTLHLRHPRSTCCLGSKPAARRPCEGSTLCVSCLWSTRPNHRIMTRDARGMAGVAPCNAQMSCCCPSYTGREALAAFLGSSCGTGPMGAGGTGRNAGGGCMSCAPPPPVNAARGGAGSCAGTGDTSAGAVSLTAPSDLRPTPARTTAV